MNKINRCWPVTEHLSGQELLSRVDAHIAANVKGFDCKNLCLSPPQYNKIEKLADEFINKYAKLASDATNFKDFTIIIDADREWKQNSEIEWAILANYNVPVQVKGVNDFDGLYNERLECVVKRVVNHTNHEEIEPNSRWVAEACYRPRLVEGVTYVFGEEPYECEKKNIVIIDLKDPTKHQEIPKDTKDIPLFSEKTTLLEIGIGSLCTIFFAYKAYKEIRKIYEENRRKPVEKESHTKAKDEKKSSSDTALKAATNKSKEKASRRRALGYTAAAIGSGAYTLYTIAIYGRFKRI